MNIYDIAREAGVSITTVSRVLNHKGNVNADTREKVEKVLKAYDYKPSAIARSLVNKTMHTVAVLTIDIREPHYARTAYTIERELSRSGYEVIICNTGGDLKETERYLQSMMEKHVDGIILVGSIFNEIGKVQSIRDMLKTFPVVLANGELKLKKSYSVMVDDQYGISLAVEHLTEKGHKDIWFFMDGKTDSTLNKRQGFLNAMEAHQIEGASDRIVETERSLQGGQAGVKKLWDEKKKVSAIVCANDDTAAGALQELLRMGVKVPDEVAVTGYNNSEYARICYPRLTTIDNKPELVAMLCVQLLISLMKETDNYSSGVIRPELIVGETT